MENDAGIVTHSSSKFDKRRFSAILIMSIFSTQVSTAAILDNLILVTRHSTYAASFTIFYYILTLLASIPQSGFSDDSGRKKHLLIASSCVLFSVLYFLVAIIFRNEIKDLNPITAAVISLLPPCFLLGFAGNAIPIARGCLSALKIHDFRSAIGLTTVAIGFGWITINLLNFILPPSGVILFSVILQAVILFLVKFFYKHVEKSYIHKKKFFHIVFSSYKLCGAMLLVAGGAAAFSAYFLTETSFYQIYSLDELSDATVGKKTMGILMGITYFVGVIFQWVTYPSDKNCLKIGVGISFISLLMLFILNFFVCKNHLSLRSTDESSLSMITGILQASFSFGFGFSVPALFTMMSTKIHEHHSGRLFGAVDTTDTAALGFSSILLYLRDRFKFNSTFLSTSMLILFSISLIFYYNFIKVFRSYEKESSTE